MPVRIPVAEPVLRWAIGRSGQSRESVMERFPALPDWEAGTTRPTLRQLEAFASATHAPIGYLFLAEPPAEPLPIADFRTVADVGAGQPSGDLLDTIYVCRQRQAWYRDYAAEQGLPPVAFVGSARLGDSSESIAHEIRDVIGFGMHQRDYGTWSAAVAGLATQLETVGVLVMISGIVGSNTRRVLDADEFRGFTLSDDLAPLIFVNGADGKGAQSFTLAHEAAHLWLGDSAVSNARPDVNPNAQVERWCNEVAAELLVPMADFRQVFDRHAVLAEEASRLARRYKVSALVVLRRALDAGFIQWPQFQAAYESAVQAAAQAAAASTADGGSFYATTAVRTSKRFLRAIVGDTLEGRTLYRDTFRLLGFRSQATFDEFANRLHLA